MKVFIWDWVSKCTDSWHEDGGVVVVAADEAAARALANQRPGCAIKEDEAPALVLPVEGAAEARVFIMPNAGCC